MTPSSAHTSIRARRSIPTEARPAPIEFPSWPTSVLAVPVLARAALFVVVLAVEPWSVGPTSLVPAWAQILQAGCFASLAFVLLRYGRDDRRAWSLGLFVVDVAATLLTPFVRAIEAPSSLAWAGLHLRTDAFQAALVWFFASLFPRSSVHPGLARLFYLGTGAAFALGAILVVLDSVAQVFDGTSPWLQLAAAVQRDSPGDGDWYFTLQFLSLSPLLWLMPRKLRESGPGDRRRLAWLTLGILIGFLPLAINVVVTTLWPSFAADERSLRLRVNVVVVALTVVPIAGAYASLVQRTLDVKLVIRRAFQQLLARSFARALFAAPLVGLVVFVVVNREQSLSAMAAGRAGLLLAGLAVAAVAAALGRNQLMAALDRRFFREHAHARTVLLAAAVRVADADSVGALRESLTRAIDQAFGPETLVTVVVGADRSFHAIDADLAPLGGGSALAQLVAATDAPLTLSAESSALTERLGVRDRAWIQAARAQLLAPLRGAAGRLVGVLALGEKGSELPYSAEDCSLLAALGRAAGLTLERCLADARDGHGSGLSVLADLPARECVDCGTVYRPDSQACSCGGALQRAAAPYTLDDRLRFERRVGAGAMGVVYRVRDLRLEQVRAVKTLLGADPAMMARLRREARAMASAQHLNLATLHGVEIWRGAPMLVMEFLEGGTLADWLRRGVVPQAEVLHLGRRLAEGLDAIHTIGLLHRDIKPSNIGFTAGGVPKLLDFGLAKVVGAIVLSTGQGATDSTGSVAISKGAGIHGTPAYLSPEVVNGDSPTVSDDLWGLSVTLLEACTGRNPFQAATVVATLARVSADGARVREATSSMAAAWATLFTDLLGPPSRRPATARLLAERLTQLS